MSNQQPEFEPSINQMIDFSSFISHVESLDAHKLGYVLVRPPQEWKQQLPTVMMPQTGNTSSLVVLCEHLSLPLLHDSVHACVRAKLARSPHVRSIVCERRTQTHKHKHQHKHDSNTNTNKLELNN